MEECRKVKKSKGQKVEKLKSSRFEGKSNPRAGSGTNIYLEWSQETPLNWACTGKKFYPLCT